MLEKPQRIYLKTNIIIVYIIEEIQITKSTIFDKKNRFDQTNYKQQFFLKIAKMDQFKIICELGRGSFGKVYQVIKNPEGSIYALKKIRMDHLGQKQKDYALNEVRLLASIDAPNIIKYKNAFFDIEDNSLCIVMQYADGGDLATFIKNNRKQNQRISEKQIIKISSEIIRGLQILHKNTIIHRDIKSANVFIVNGVAKLGDMNISKVLQGKFASTVAGTPLYLSPEIWKSQKYDYKSDIWSFGCLLYEMCQFQTPFQAISFSMIMNKVLTGHYRQISNKYSQNLQKIIKQCLSINPLLRPSAQKLSQMSFFRLQQQNRGQIKLINAIKCPKMLSNLNKKMPLKKYSKELNTMKLLSGYNQDQNQYQIENKENKFTSERKIQNFEQVEKFKKDNEIFKQNKHQSKNKYIIRKKFKPLSRFRQNQRIQ